MILFGKRLALALALSLVAVACAPPNIPDDGTGGENPDVGEGASTGKKTPKKTTPEKTGAEAESEADPGTTADATPPKTTTPPATTPPPNNCAQAADPDACFDCCDQASGGTLAKADAAFGQCACEGQCATECGATYCNGGQPSAACDQCLTQTCQPAANALCTSAACKAGAQCAQQCRGGA